jgi:hypothetical protein
VTGKTPACAWYAATETRSKGSSERPSRLIG